MKPNGGEHSEGLINDLVAEGALESSDNKFTKDITREVAQAKQVLKEAERILGPDVFGPTAVEKTFGLKLEIARIPKVPFVTQELERAKELGQMLILRVDKASDGQPLTMKKIQAILQPVFEKEDKGRVLYGVDWYKGEDFYATETPKFSWALVSKEVIPDSTSKNYLEQTDQLASYLETAVFKDKPVPEVYQEAIREFKTQRSTIKPLIDSGWQKATEILSGLKFNQLVRQTPVATLYDLLLVLQAGDERLLEDKYTWTSRRASGGRLVVVGYFDSRGADVGHWLPGLSDVCIGVSFSRSQ
jgi:hypothetical protein